MATCEYCGEQFDEALDVGEFADEPWICPACCTEEAADAAILARTDEIETELGVEADRQAVERFCREAEVDPGLAWINAKRHEQKGE